MQEIRVWSCLPQEGPLEESMASHSSIHTWRIPRTEEPGRLQSMGSHRVRQDWNSWAHTQGVGLLPQSLCLNPQRVGLAWGLTWKLDWGKMHSQAHTVVVIGRIQLLQVGLKVSVPHWLFALDYLQFFVMWASQDCSLHQNMHSKKSIETVCSQDGNCTFYNLITRVIPLQHCHILIVRSKLPQWRRWHKAADTRGQGSLTTIRSWMQIILFSKHLSVIMSLVWAVIISGSCVWGAHSHLGNRSTSTCNSHGKCYSRVRFKTQWEYRKEGCLSSLKISTMSLLLWNFLCQSSFSPT